MYSASRTPKSQLLVELPKVISEALGHSSVAFTLDAYSHILPDMQEEAMALLDRILPEGKNGGVQKI